MKRMEQLYEGKAKKVFATDDPSVCIVSYKDDATAFNGQKKGTIVGKGAINNRLTNYFMTLLEKEGIPYLAHEYPHGKEAVDGVTVASLLGQDPGCVFKTLVTRGASGDYYVFVVPVAEELDLKKCARAVGEKSVEMIHVRDITRVTGYVRGGCSPLGMKKQYRTTFHLTAGELSNIVVSAGKIGYQIDLSPKDLIRLTNAQLCDIIKL